MSDRIRIIKHEAVPGCGSFEVRFPDGRASQFFYWDDIPARRLRPEMLDRETALETAKAVARAARDRSPVRVGPTHDDWGPDSAQGQQNGSCANAEPEPPTSRFSSGLRLLGGANRKL